MGATHRSGFVGIVGRPNVGKSTILNHYLHQKIAIVSPKPQTTRHRILGVLTRPDAQVLFLDTPGFHQPEDVLGRYMLAVAKSVMEEADVLVLVIDGSRGITEEDRRVIGHMKRVLGERTRQTPAPAALCAINKVDVVKKPRLLPILESCAKLQLFDECIPVSALTGEQMDVLLERIVVRLPEGPRWYEPQQHTDQTTEQRVSELIREQILLATRQEVPHATAILLEELITKARVISVQATVLVERPGQKAILIGRGGAMLQRIGRSARQELERLLGRKVFLGLWVKVAEDWRRDGRVLQQLGYDAPQ